ncbi:hypothetical protein Q7P37_011574 [Cladosporium fusiforme]
MGGGPANEHILIARPLPEPTKLLEELRARHPHIEFTYYESKQGETPPASLFAKVTILCTFATLPADPEKDAPNLTWLHLFSAGSNHIQNHPLYTDTKTTITTSSGIHGPTIAEWAVLTRLVLSRKYNTLRELQKQHRWSSREAGIDHVRDQVGATLGVLGYGSIGRQIARVARGMGMRVLAFTATPKDSAEKRRDGGFVVPGTGDVEGEIPEEWFSGLEKEELHHFLGQGIDWLVEEFEVLKKGGSDGKEGSPAFVTNIARGPIIQQEALVQALKDGTLEGAALDVTDPEPLPEDSELWDLENVVVTPHISGNGVAYEERAFQVLEVNLERREKGESLINVVNRKRGLFLNVEWHRKDLAPVLVSFTRLLARALRNLSTMTTKTAYITGGASGIGLAVAQALSKRQMRVAIADINLSAAQDAVKQLNASATTGQEHLAVEVDVSSWDSQVAAFEKVVATFKVIDVVVVNAGVGEKVFIPNDGGKGQGFVKPDLRILSVDLDGFLYTSALAVQQMRRQEVGDDGLRGKIIGTASVCGFYCVPTLPVYTAAKHGAVGFVRSYGKYLPEEKMTLNAVCPHVARTSISTSTFYDSLESQSLLTPMEGIVEAFMQFIDRDDLSGECLEIGPVGGPQLRSPATVLNQESEVVNGLLYKRGHILHEPKS